MVEWKRWNDSNDVVWELYDYKNDPQETRNIASEQPEVLEQLKEILASHPLPKRANRR
jgi:iduronate 2-sulfatase